MKNVHKNGKKLKDLKLEGRRKKGEDGRMRRNNETCNWVSRKKWKSGLREKVNLGAGSEWREGRKRVTSENGWRKVRRHF